MENHPITPPPELVYRLQDLGNLDAIELAYRAGADMELEACCEWLVRNYNYPEVANPLRAARRPKPPSLKELAYDALDTYVYGSPDPKDKERTYNAIRRALEQL
jgi:hypothetical protein